MALSQKEKKRRSRASKPQKYHDHERETSRKRMAIYRAKNKAQKRASQLRSLLCPEDQAEVTIHVARQRQRLVADWFAYHGLRFDPKMLREPAVLRSFMTKIEMHKIELQVAEFEISVIEDRDDDEMDEEEAGLGFVAAARLELDRAVPKAPDPAPKSLSGAQKGLLERLEKLESVGVKPAKVATADRPAKKSRTVAVDATSSSGAVPGSKGEPAPVPPTRTIAKAAPPSRKYPQAKPLAKPIVVTATDRPILSGATLKSALKKPSLKKPCLKKPCLKKPPRKHVRALGPAAPRSPAATSAEEREEVLSNEDIDRLIHRAVAPVVTDAEEGSADGAASPSAEWSPVPPPPSLAAPAAPPATRSPHDDDVVTPDAPPSDPLAALPPLPTFVEGRYADEVSRSDEGIHRAIADAMRLYRASACARPSAPQAPGSKHDYRLGVRSRARQEEQMAFDASVDRAVAAAMAQLSRGEPLRRRTVAPPPGVEGRVERVEDVRFRTMDLSALAGGDDEEGFPRVEAPPHEGEEPAPEDRIVAEALELVRGMAEEDARPPAEEAGPRKRGSEEAPPSPRPADDRGTTAGPFESEEATRDVRAVADAHAPPDDSEVAEAMQLFGAGLLGDVPPPPAVPEAAQDELLRMDMECFDIGTEGLAGLGGIEGGGLGVVGIEEETFGAEAFLW